jgi:hypothetical protein
MYCPECGCEYREGFTECSDCHVTLRPGEPPDPLPDASPGPPRAVIENLELVPVLACGNAAQLALARGVLDDAGIPYLLNDYGASVSRLGEHGVYWGSSATIQVASDRAREAQALLAPFEEG